jgi:hypothetical protein
MSTFARDDRWLTDAQGRALAGAQVYYCTQPANTANVPPSPLATVYTDSTGDTPVTQPLITDGFGHCDAYLNNAVLYTVVFVHPLFGANPVVLNDQAVGLGGGTQTYATFAGGLTGTINGTNTVFGLTVDGTNPLPSGPVLLSLYKNGVFQTQGVDFSLSGVTVTMAMAPVAGDALYANGAY